MRGNQGNDRRNKEGNNRFIQSQHKHKVCTVTTKPASTRRHFKLSAIKVQKIKSFCETGLGIKRAGQMRVKLGKRITCNLENVDRKRVFVLVSGFVHMHSPVRPANKTKLFSTALRCFFKYYFTFCFCRFVV